MVLATVNLIESGGGTGALWSPATRTGQHGRGVATYGERNQQDADREVRNVEQIATTSTEVSKAASE